jgi:sugar lactone lactonase YvrE
MHLHTIRSTTRPFCGAILGLSLAILAAGCSDAANERSIAVNVSTFAGSGAEGHADGAARSARFSEPWGIAVDQGGNVYVADSGNHRIRRIAPGGEVTTLAGTGVAGFRDGAASEAQFHEPRGLAVDSTGNVYVADLVNSRVRKLTPERVVSTILDTSNEPAVGRSFDMDRLNRPAGVAVDTTGNVYVTLAFTVRRITPDGTVQAFAGSGDEGYGDGPAAQAKFRGLGGIAVDRAGNVYLADPANSRIRRVAPDGMVTTLAGSGERGFQDGEGKVARFKTPAGLAVDGEGNVYVADANNHAIRRITPAGVVSTIAGNGNPGAKDGSTRDARFDGPFGVALDTAAAMYVSDSTNHRIRKIAR